MKLKFLYSVPELKIRVVTPGRVVCTSPAVQASPAAEGVLYDQDEYDW